MLRNHSLSLALSLIIFPTLSYSGQAFEISNHTASDATFIVNHDCSALVLGARGIIKPKQDQKLDEHIVTSLCANSGKICTIDFYLSNNCTGSVAATVVLHLEKGVQTLDSKKDSGISLSKKSDNGIVIENQATTVTAK